MPPVPLPPATPSPPPATPAARLRARWFGAVLAAAGAAAVSGALAWAWPGVPWLAPLLTAAAVALALSWRLRSWHAATGQAGAAGPATDASLRDPETGMFHRPAFLALAERDWLRAGRDGGAVALLLIEVDHLRAMTDRAGPRVGDALLGGLGCQVLASLRAADLLARFDDAQLAVFLPQADPTGALDVADRIRGLVQQLSLPGLPESAAFSASVGVAVLRPLHQPLSGLVADAQQALHKARLAGGNCVRIAPEATLPTSDADPWVGDDSARPARGGDA